MADVMLYGPAYSSYTRIVRMALAEKTIDYELIEVDYAFAGAHQSEEHLARHPFGKLPVLDHNGFRVYEATAIARYVDEAFPGPALQPSDPIARARMNQVIGIVDSYLTPIWMLGIVMPRVVYPMRGEASDERLIAESTAKAGTIARVLDGFLAETSAFFAGDAVSLADFFVYPQYVYAAMTAEVSKHLVDAANLRAWADRMAARPSTRATEYPDVRV